MFELEKKLAKTLVVTICVAIPAPLLAGAYGESAVRDGAVANTARSQATVPCPRLNRNIPASLASEMDCGSAQATPRVAGERVRNNPIASFFDRFPNQRRNDPTSSREERSDDPKRSPDDDVVTVDPTPPDDGPTDGSSEPKGKWDRLSELGVTPDNFSDQSDGFREQVRDYLGGEGFETGDWTNFDPN